MNETQIVEWGKAFRKELPDPKVRKLFDQYIRYKSNPKSGIPEDKLLTKSEAIEEAITYYSIKYEIAIPDRPEDISPSSGSTSKDVTPDKSQSELYGISSKDDTPEEVVDMDKFAISAKPTNGGAGKKEDEKPEKKTRSRRKKTEESEESKKTKAAPKPKKKPATTAAPPPPPEVKPPASLVATFLEKEMETLQVDDVEIIHLTLYEYDGRKFYRDEKKGKIYQVGRNGSKGNYIGRWNYRSSTIETDIPDSDSES
jgi:hypothetical protein